MAHSSSCHDTPPHMCYEDNVPTLYDRCEGINITHSNLIGLQLHSWWTTFATEFSKCTYKDCCSCPLMTNITNCVEAGSRHCHKSVWSGPQICDPTGHGPGDLGMIIIWCSYLQVNLMLSWHSSDQSDLSVKVVAWGCFGLRQLDRLIKKINR